MDKKFFIGVSAAAVVLLIMAIGSFQVAAAFQKEAVIKPILSNNSIPFKISFQGMLTEDGNPVNGTRNMDFKLFTTSDCSGTALATITKPNVDVEKGLFQVGLEVDPIHFNVQALWIQVQVGTAVLGCEEILPAPYALYSVSTGSLHMRPVSTGAPSLNQVLKWDGTTWVPAADANTTYTAGSGLSLTGTQFSADFAGSGAADTIARSDHNHFGQSWSGSDSLGLVINNSKTGGTAIFGNATGNTDNTIGVYGQNVAPVGSGVYGRATAAPGTTSFGVAGHHYWNGTGVGAWSYLGRLIEGRSGDYPGGTLRFYVTNGGQVYAQGGYTTFVSTSDGKSNDYAALFAVQSPEAWFEDFGTASLTNGEVLVLIDPLFATAVNLNSDYHVFLTPMGESDNLYVADQTPTSFTVREANGGRASISFHYRIVAKRQGYEEIRFETITLEDSSPTERQEGAPDG
jgi:hypothetical protein